MYYLLNLSQHSFEVDRINNPILQQSKLGTERLLSNSIREQEHLPHLRGASSGHSLNATITAQSLSSVKMCKNLIGETWVADLGLSLPAASFSSSPNYFFSHL